MADLNVNNLPFLIAGPIVRRLVPEQMVLWLVTREPLHGRFVLYQDDKELTAVDCKAITTSIAVGKYAYIHLINYHADPQLPENVWLSYDLICQIEGEERGLKWMQPSLLYDDEPRPHFVLKTKLDQMLHGSCRKPHHPSEDGLLRVDDLLQHTQGDVEQRPAMLLMSGDQIYADDVAGPMLSAIHQVIEKLGLSDEEIKGATVVSGRDLYQSVHCYYEREALLPKIKANKLLKDTFFGGAKKPIFTADTAHNHLITLSEVLAMYFLVWSPQLWPLIRLDASAVSSPYRERYLNEYTAIISFSKQLDRVQRALAHLPVYMIFDDHDVTDDWNLTRGWEEAAYNHPFSRQIIGNALIGYWLCQGWGNAPEKFPQKWEALTHRITAEGDSTEGSNATAADESHQTLITEVLAFDAWNYSLNTQPKLIVLDTRTQRWWSEDSLSKPSGLMDWEELSELQMELMGENSVILVSAAPIFGMKFIEMVQRVFTFFGQALMVDAENWMAHSGSANVILNIFRHSKTPQNFIVLSGDVHYSFVYDIKIRFRKNSPDIWQITCSGIKNEFPNGLLKLFDRLNRWFYGSASPLNWFTKRRRMQIRARIADTASHRRVLNRSGIGLLSLNDQGQPKKVSVLTADGKEVEFPARDQTSQG